ncbi:hypothetical protein OTSUT76_2418 [Orientia tsutsugamushi str. UT76]|nr:hypothetical protein OTSUT76_2418 [Orientia tsutsugamushi str. UT76]
MMIDKAMCSFYSKTNHIDFLFIFLLYFETFYNYKFLNYEIYPNSQKWLHFVKFENNTAWLRKILHNIPDFILTKKHELA